MSIIRVLHIVGKMDRAGAETMLMNLYRQIDRAKIQFDFITFLEGKGDYDDEIINLGGRVIPIIAKDPISRMLKLTKFLKNNPEYQIVHAHMLLSNAFHLLAAKKAGVKHRISHSHSTSNGKTGLINKTYEKWSLLINRNLSTYKIACGNLAANYLFGSAKDVLVLPNAVDVDKMIKTSEVSRNYIEDNFSHTTESLGIKIIQVGRLSKVKNHDFTLKIAKELKKRQVIFTILIIGQGPLEDQLKSEVIKENLENQVLFLGVRSDISELMASADYMIMPSLHEGFPVVLVEAQTVGLPSIISDKISPEVDLGLDLIEFLPLTNINVWADRLVQPKTLKIDSKRIKSTLKAHGFDVKSNASTLSNLYSHF